MTTQSIRALVLTVVVLGGSAVAVEVVAAPGERIGAAITVVNQVTASYARDTRALEAGDGVRQNERILVDRDARSELEFADKTKLALGPGSELVLDKFVYDPAKAKGTISMDMVKGTLRWITGVASKPSYTIRVPNASITVRGTTFDLMVTEPGETWLLLHEGSVQVCNARGECRVHEESCKLVRVSDTGDVSGPTSWRNLPGARDNTLHLAFPFVVLPPQFDSEPACSRSDIMGQRDAGAPPPPPEPKVRKASVEHSVVPSSALAKPPLPKSPLVNMPVREAREEPVFSKPVPERKPKYVLPGRGSKITVPKPRYEPPRRDTKIYFPKPPRKIVKIEPSRVKLPARVKYPRHSDNGGNDRPRKRGGSGVGKAIVGAAVIGAAAIAIGAMKHRGGGGYGY